MIGCVSSQLKPSVLALFLAVKKVEAENVALLGLYHIHNNIYSLMGLSLNTIATLFHSRT